MLKIGDLFFPDGEDHFTHYGDSIADYGGRDRAAAYSYVKRWRRALDVGANVGIFSRDFAKRFEEVVAFEPMPDTRECLAVNVQPNVRIEPVAIADKPGVLEMYRTPSSGGSFICNHPHVTTIDYDTDPAQVLEVPVRTIDSFEFDAVDLIKLDIQGAEYLALCGARETIMRHRPVILVEEKPLNDLHAHIIKKTGKLLIGYGMAQKEKIQTDRVYVFED